MNAQDGFPAMYFTSISRHPHLSPSVIFVNENENGEKRENNEFVNEN